MINRAYQSGWNDNYTITVTYWTSSHGRGQSRQGSQVGKGMSKNDFSEQHIRATGMMGRPFMQLTMFFDRAYVCDCGNIWWPTIVGLPFRWKNVVFFFFFFCFVFFVITKTYLYNFDPLKPHFYIVKLGFTGEYIIFLISAQNIDCGYSLEPPPRGGSNECPQSMFWAEMWKISEFFIWKFSFLGGEIFSIFE